MDVKRLVLSAAALACLLGAAPARADESGGAAYQPYDGVGGGIGAPLEDVGPGLAATGGAPVAERAQEETPTTPEGEPQPPAQEPNGEQEPIDEETEPLAPVADPVAPDRGDETAGGGSLPRTGLQLAALASVGLGLLLAGGALWPTSSWPPPRGRRRPPRRPR